MLPSIAASVLACEYVYLRWYLELSTTDDLGTAYSEGSPVSNSYYEYTLEFWYAYLRHVEGK